MKKYDQVKSSHYRSVNSVIRDILLALCLLFTTAAWADDCSSLKSISWIAGQWTSVSDKSITGETWSMLSEASWEGRGETRDKISGELRGSESLLLVAMSGEVFYIAKVSHNELPVAFKLTECSGSRAVFENPDHGFPKKLDYLLQASGDLHVQVSDGAEQGFEIRFQKTK